MPTPTNDVQADLAKGTTEPSAPSAAATWPAGEANRRLRTGGYFANIDIG